MTRELPAEFLPLKIIKQGRMDRGLEQLSVDFNKKAQQLFMSTYERFRQVTTKLDRQKDENVFQLQIEKFMSTLKQQLEGIANDLLAKAQVLKNIDHGNRLLRERITIYLNEFRQKTRSL